MTVEFIDWGHVGTSTPLTTELVLDDVIMNRVPEPASAWFFGALIWMAARRRGILRHTRFS